MLAAMTMGESALRIGATRRPRLAASGAQQRQIEVSCFTHRPEDKLLFSHGSYSLLGMNRAAEQERERSSPFWDISGFPITFSLYRKQLPRIPTVFSGQLPESIGSSESA
jgi:hypothetical protein